jgi:hypothetical protein
MPEFKDSVTAEEAEELVTTADFKPQIRRRRRHPIGRGNAGGSAGGRTHPSNIGPWDGSQARDVVQERLDRLATGDKSVESCCAQVDSKYSTEVVGKPSPHRREESGNQRGRHGGSGCCGRGAHSQEKNCTCGKGLLRKVLGAIWPFKRSQKEQGTADAEEKNSHPPQRQRSGGGRYFRQRSRSSHQRPRSPGS